MPKITLPQKNKTIEVSAGENLMTALLRAELPVASSCDGEGICSMCRVQIEGNLPPPSELESNTLSRNKCASDERLSCQITVAQDMLVRTKYW